MTKYSLTPGVLIERVGGDLMVVVPGKSNFVRLSGSVAEVLLDVQAGRSVSSSHSALSDLVNLGILNPPGMSRRGLVKAGAVGVGAGIAVMAMPSVAMASSASATPQAFWWPSSESGEFYRFFLSYASISTLRGISATTGGADLYVGDFINGQGGAGDTTLTFGGVSLTGVRWTRFDFGSPDTDPILSGLVSGAIAWDGNFPTYDVVFSPQAPDPV